MNYSILPLAGGGKVTILKYIQSILCYKGLLSKGKDSTSTLVYVKGRAFTQLQFPLAFLFHLKGKEESKEKWKSKTGDIGIFNDFTS